LSELIAKCGINCGTCPWGPYPRKSLSAEDFEKYRKNVKRVLGYMPIRIACVTCRTPDERIPKESKLPNRKCMIRQCVDKTGVANCAYCSLFPCDTMKATAGAWNRKSIEGKRGESLSDEEYRAFVEPFEGVDRLSTIRASLKPEEIVNPAKVAVCEAITADFPIDLPFSKEEIVAFKAVHSLLVDLQHSSFGLRTTDAFAQQRELEKRRLFVLRFLWIFGCFGKMEEKSENLNIDANTYLLNRGNEKKLAIWPFVEETVFDVLGKFGVLCKRVALKGAKQEDLATGTGYLRGKGWIMKMSFSEQTGGTKALKALQIYARILDEKHGKKAFQHFSEADMQVLCEKT